MLQRGYASAGRFASRAAERCKPAPTPEHGSHNSDTSSNQLLSRQGTAFIVGLSAFLANQASLVDSNWPFLAAIRTTPPSDRPVDGQRAESKRFFARRVMLTELD